MNRERGRLRVAVLAAVVTMAMAYPQMQNDIYRKRLPSFLTASRPQRRSVSEYGPPAHVPIYINPYPQVPEDSSSKEDRGPAPPVDGYQNLIMGDREPAQQQRDQPPARGPAPPKNAHPPQSRLDEIARQVQKLLQDDQGNVDLNKVPKPVNKPGSKAPGFSPKRRNTMREAENIVKRSGYEAVPKTRTNDGLTIHSSGYNFDGEDLPPTETGSPSYPADEPDQSNYGNNNDGDDGIDEGENTNEGGYPRIQKGYRQKTTTTTTTTRRPTTTTRRTTTTQRTTTRRATPAPTTTKRPAPQRATTTQGYDAPPVAHPPTTQPPIDEGYGNAVTTTAAGYEANPPAARPKNDDGYGGETVTDGPSESYDEVTEAATPAPYGGNNIQPEPQPPFDQQYEETHKVDPYAALAEHSSGSPPPLGAHDLLSLDAKAYVEEHKRMQRAMAKKIYSEMRRQLKRELGFGESLSASSDAEHENEEKDASAEKLKGAELPALAGYQGPEPSGYDSAPPAPEPTTVHPDSGYGGEETTVAETTIAPVTLPAHIRTIVANFAKQMEKQAKKTRAEASGQATTPKEFSFDGSADRTTPATPSDGYDTVTQGYEEPVREASPQPPVDEGYGGEETTEAPEPQTTTAAPYEEVTEVQTTPMPHNPYDANEYGGEKKKTEENEENTTDYNQAGPPGQQPPTEGEEEEGGEGAATTPSSSVDEGEGGEKDKPEETEEKGDNNNGGDGTHEQKITYNETEEKPRNGGGAQGAYGGYSASHGAPVAHAPQGTVSRQLVVRQRSLSGGHQKQRVFIDYGDNGRPQIYAKQDQSPTSIQDKASGEQEEEEYPKRRGARFVPFHQVRHLFI